MRRTTPCVQIFFMSADLVSLTLWRSGQRCGFKSKGGHIKVAEGQSNFSRPGEWLIKVQDKGAWQEALDKLQVRVLRMWDPLTKHNNCVLLNLAGALACGPRARPRAALV